MRRAGAIAILAAALHCGPLHAAPPTPPPAPSDTTNRLKPVFEALPEVERRAIQDALLWTVDYVGVINGAFGPRTREGLDAFAQKLGIAPQAALEPINRARLIAAANAARADVGFALLKDKQAGVVLALPLKLLPRRTSTDTGTHYASPDGAVVADTLSRPTGPGGLPEVFDRMSAASGTRRVTYKLLKPDFFVVSGESGERKFYARFVIGTLEGQSFVRGLTLAYPKADAARWDPIVLASAASFDGLPASGPAPAAIAPPVKPPPPATFTLGAFRIAPGLALAHLPGRPCLQPSLDGSAVALRISDPASALALFEVPQAGGVPPTLAPGPVSAGSMLLAVFKSGSGGMNVAPAEVQAPNGFSTGFVVSAGLQGQAEGVPVIDREGRLIGVVGESKRVSPLIAGVRVQNDYPVVAAAGIKALLASAGVAGLPSERPSAVSLAAVAAAWDARLLTIVCRTAEATP